MKILALHCVLWIVSLLLTLPVSAKEVTIQVREAELSEVVEMIAQQQQVNVLMSGDVDGTVSISLYDTPLKEALTAIANAAGFALEQHGGNYFILPHDQIGTYQNGSLTSLRVYDVDYVDGEELKSVIEDHVSLYGKVNYIPKRNVMIVQDQPDFLRQIDRLMSKVDQQPQQVLIEAKILEVTLNDDESLGIDWQNLFQSDGGSGGFGVRGNTNLGDGFFFDLVTPNVEVALNALQDEGRLNTLSTPKLVALENEEASVVIGDRRGYQVTTTINQVTTESIEFLESGVILRVTAEIDENGRILMSVHPEVSNGTVDANGIPSQTTTEVTTNILVPSGETIFIGGLMKQTDSLSRTSVPVVNRVPGLRRLFASKERNLLTTETVVLIRPIIADDFNDDWNRQEIDAVESFQIEEPTLEPWTLTAADTDQAANAQQVVDQGAVETVQPVQPAQRKVEAPMKEVVEEVKDNSTPETTPAKPENGIENIAIAQVPVNVLSASCPTSELLFCYDDHCVCEST